MIKPVTLGAAILASVIPFTSGCSEKKETKQEVNSSKLAEEYFSADWDDVGVPNENTPLIYDSQIRQLAPVRFNAFSIEYNEKTGKIEWGMLSDETILDVLRKHASNSEKRNKDILKAFKEEAVLRINAFNNNKTVITKPLDLRNESPVTIEKGKLPPEAFKRMRLTQYGFPFCEASMKGSMLEVDSNSFTLKRYFDKDGKVQEGVCFEYNFKNPLESPAKRRSIIIPIEVPVVFYHYNNNGEITHVEFIATSSFIKSK